MNTYRTLHPAMMVMSLSLRMRIATVDWTLQAMGTQDTLVYHALAELRDAVMRPTRPTTWITTQVVTYYATR